MNNEDSIHKSNTELYPKQQHGAFSIHNSWFLHTRENDIVVERYSVDEFAMKKNWNFHHRLGDKHQDHSFVHLRIIVERIQSSRIVVERWEYTKRNSLLRLPIWMQWELTPAIVWSWEIECNILRKTTNWFDTSQVFRSLRSYTIVSRLTRSHHAIETHRR